MTTEENDLHDKVITDTIAAAPREDAVVLTIDEEIRNPITQIGNRATVIGIPENRTIVTSPENLICGTNNEKITGETIRAVVVLSETPAVPQESAIPGAMIPSAKIAAGALRI